MEDNKLQHYGVIGMKWGRRKQKVDPSYKKAHAKTKVKYLSDNDLRDINNRLNAERQYKDLTKKKRLGKKAVDAFVKTAGTITAVTVAYGVYKKTGTQILDKIGGLSA